MVRDRSKAATTTNARSCSANRRLATSRAIAPRPIRASTSSGTPMSTGHNAPLNKAITPSLERNDGISEQEIEEIYDNYLSPLRFSDRVDQVGVAPHGRDRPGHGDGRGGHGSDGGLWRGVARRRHPIVRSGRDARADPGRGRAGSFVSPARWRPPTRSWRNAAARNRATRDPHAPGRPRWRSARNR